MKPRPVFKSCFVIIFTLLLNSSSLLDGYNQEADKPAVPRVLSAMDTLRINQVSSPHLSPDGQWVVYTMSIEIWKIRILKAPPISGKPKGMEQIKGR